MIVRTRQSELTRRLTEELNVAKATIENLEADLAAQHAENRRLRDMLVREMQHRHNLERDLSKVTTEVSRLLEEDERHSIINEELQIMNEELEAAHRRIEERLFDLRRLPTIMRKGAVGLAVLVQQGLAAIG